MNISDGLIDKWSEEAIDDLGKKGWREISPNSLMLIIYAAQRARDKKLVKSITRPIWYLVYTLIAGGIWWIISSITGISAGAG